MIMLSKQMDVMKMIQTLSNPGQVLHPVSGGTLTRVTPFTKEYDKRIT
jgi:hypothetical protein